MAYVGGARIVLGERLRDFVCRFFDVVWRPRARAVRVFDECVLVFFRYEVEKGRYARASAFGYAGKEE